MNFNEKTSNNFEVILLICDACHKFNLETSRFCINCGGFLKPSISSNDNKETLISYAGLLPRLGSLVIDLAFVIIGFLPLAILSDFTYGWTGKLLLLFMILLYGIGVWLYFSLFESSSKQATLGKIAFGEIVTDIDGNRLTFKKASKRFWIKYFLSLIPFLGFVDFLWIGFAKKKQSLHDEIMSTLVLETGKELDSIVIFLIIFIIVFGIINSILILIGTSSFLKAFLGPH